VVAPRNLIVLSFNTDASCLSSGEIVTAKRIQMVLVPTIGKVHYGEKSTAIFSNNAPVTTPDSLTVLSSNVDAGCLPSGEKITVRTPSSVYGDALETATHNITVQSLDVDTSRLPSGGMTTGYEWPLSV